MVDAIVPKQHASARAHDDDDDRGNRGERWSIARAQNPGGMTRDERELRRSIRELSRECGPELVASLREIALRPTAKDADRIAAGLALLDRGYGRPAQSVELSGPSGGPIESGPALDVSRLTPAERAELLRLVDAAAGVTT